MVQKVPHLKSMSSTSPQKEMKEYLYNGMRMSVRSKPSIQYQDGMELRDRKMTEDCTQPLRIGNLRALNGCAGRLFGAATLHNHKNSANKSNRKAMNRNWSNQKAIPALKTKTGNK